MISQISQNDAEPTPGLVLQVEVYGQEPSRVFTLELQSRDVLPMRRCRRAVRWRLVAQFAITHSIVSRRPKKPAPPATERRPRRD
jgi:hypothetical protein